MGLLGTINQYILLYIFYELDSKTDEHIMWRRDALTYKSFICFGKMDMKLPIQKDITDKMISDFIGGQELEDVYMGATTALLS